MDIQTQDGILLRGIPDGTPDEAIKARIATIRAQRGDTFDPAEGMSGTQKFLAGAGKALTDIGRGAGQMLGVVSQQDVDEAKQRDAALMNTGAGMAGNLTGNVAAALPTMLIPGVNTVAGAGLVGAGMGALQPTATGESRLQNATIGGLAGAGGQVAGNLIGRAIRPVQSTLSPERAALAQRAQQLNIPLDAADLTGSRPLTIMRDVMSNLPLTADRQAAIQGTKQAAFNRAVGDTFGANADALTPQVLQSARDRLGQQFTDLSSRNTLQANQGLVQDLANLQAQVNRYATSDVAKVVNNNIDDVLSKIEAGDVIPGRAYRELDSQIGRLSRSSASGDVRNYLGELRNSLRGAMDQSISAADRDAWREARKQYANLMTVAPLAAKSETGDVSGRTLLAAALRGSKSSAFTGGGELGELGKIGRAFVMEQTPNSGTAQRTFYQRFLENPLTAAWGQGVGVISLPVQSAMNSKAGQAYLANGLKKLTPQQLALANALARSTAMGVAANAE